MHGPRYPFSRSGLEFLATGSWPQLPSDRPTDRLSSCRSAWAPCSTPLSLRRLGTAVHRDDGMEMALDQAGDDDAGCVAVDWAGLLRQAQPTRPLWLAGWLAGWLVRALPPPRRRPRRCSGRAASGAASFSSAFTHLVALSLQASGGLRDQAGGPPLASPHVAASRARRCCSRGGRRRRPRVRTRHRIRVCWNSKSLSFGIQILRIQILRIQILRIQILRIQISRPSSCSSVH